RTNSNNVTLKVYETIPGTNRTGNAHRVDLSGLPGNHRRHDHLGGPDAPQKWQDIPRGEFPGQRTPGRFGQSLARGRLLPGQYRLPDVGAQIRGQSDERANGARNAEHQGGVGAGGAWSDALYESVHLFQTAPSRQP